MRRSSLFALIVTALGACAGPQDPEIHSGRNANYRHADEVTTSDTVSGHVSYAKGNRTDWTLVDLPADGDLVVHSRVTPDDSDGEIAVELYDPNGNHLGSLEKRDNPFKALGAGSYYLEVYAPTHKDGGSYRISFDFTPLPKYPPPPTLATLPPFSEPHEAAHVAHSSSKRHATILLAQRQGTFTILNLDVGSADGVAEGWSGTVLDHGGSPISGTDFTVGHEVSKHSCVAVTKALPSALGSRTVEIGP